MQCKLCMIFSVSTLPRSELSGSSPPQQVQSQRGRSLLLFARVWQGGRSGRNTTSWSQAGLDISESHWIVADFAETYFFAYQRWKEHNIISNRNQNSESYNQICASVSCSTAKDSTDRVKKEHVYWMTWEIMQGSSPEFCLDQWAWYKSSFKFGLSVMNFRRTHWQVTSSVYCCRLFHMDTQ